MTSKSGAIYVGVSALHRRRKAPMRFGGFFTKAAKDLHRQEYIEANNTIADCIQDRPDQPGLTFLRTLESLVVKAGIFFFCRVLHTIFSQLRTHAFARSVTVTRSSAVYRPGVWRLSWAFHAASNIPPDVRRGDIGE